jgi:hypothetical protein
VFSPELSAAEGRAVLHALLPATRKGHVLPLLPFMELHGTNHKDMFIVVIQVF